MPATDDFLTFSPDISGPAGNGADIVPNNTVDFERVTRGIYVGGAGNLRVTFVGGQTVTLFNVVAGMIYPLRVSRVWATGTTATNLVGLR